MAYYYEHVMAPPAGFGIWDSYYPPQTGYSYWGMEPSTSLYGGGDLLEQWSRERERRYQAMLDLLARQGAAERSAIERRYSALGSRVAQDLVSRGLASSTVLPSMQMGIERERTEALGGLEERLRGQQLDILRQREAGEPSFGEMLQLAEIQGRTLGQYYGGLPLATATSITGVRTGYTVPRIRRSSGTIGATYRIIPLYGGY